MVKKYAVYLLAFFKNAIQHILPLSKEDTIVENKEPTTVFERVLARQKAEQRVFKYRYAVIIGITVVVIAGLSVFADYMLVFNKNLPRTLCDKIITGYEQNQTQIFVDNCTNLSEVLKDSKILAEYFDLYLPKDKFTYYRVAADKIGEHKYIFKSGNLKIAEIIFKKQKNTARYGVDKYKVKSFEIRPLTQYGFTSYSTFTLLINGIPADDYMYLKNEVFDNFNSVLETPITKNLYIINDVNYVKSVKALDTDGSILDVVINNSDSAYNVTIKCEDKEKELTEYFNGFVLEYMHYTVKNSAKTEGVLSYIEARSPLYLELENYRIRNNAPFENERVENLKLENLTYYGSGYYSCDVSADYLTDEKEETVTQSFKKTLYLLFSDGKYFIVDIVDLEVTDQNETVDTEENQVENSQTEVTEDGQTENLIENEAEVSSEETTNTEIVEETQSSEVEETQTVEETENQ